MNSKPNSLKDLDNQSLFDLLTKGISKEQDSINLKKLFKESTTLHYNLFVSKIFTQTINKTDINPEGNNVLEYILPTVRKAYSKFFIDVPSLFNHTHSRVGVVRDMKDSRLELFQLQFNLKEFLEILSIKFKKNRNILKDFEYLDSISEILTLIVENYGAEKLKYTLEKSSSDIQSEIRDTKLDKQLGL